MPDTPRPIAPSLSAWRVRSLLMLLRGALQNGEDLGGWLTRHPVLHTVLDEAAALGLNDLTLDDALSRLDQVLTAHVALDATTANFGSNRHEAPASADADAPEHRLQRLAHALELTPDDLGMWVAITLPEDDPRLADFIDELHGEGGLLTRSTLVRCWAPMTVARALQRLQAAHLIQPRTPESGQPQLLRAQPALWELACGLPPANNSWLHQPWQSLPALDELILPEAWRSRLQATLPEQLWPASHTAGRPNGQLIARREPRACWALRGLPGSGRRTLAAALAHSQGQGLIEAVDAAHLPALGAAAALLGAIPLVSFDPTPGERLNWQPPIGCTGLVVARLPQHGGLAVNDRPVHTLELDAPNIEERRQHWRLALSNAPQGTQAAPLIEPTDELLDLRLPRGTLHRLARSLHQQPSTDQAAPADLHSAVLRQLDEAGRFALDGIAQRMPDLHTDEALALPGHAQDEFDTLVARCRHRDRLASLLPSAFGHSDGVKALFKGPSGTGKTLAARHLAHALNRPLYRVDLAATVSKYIGETERNLERVFEAAESLDVVLLLDEGDALMAGRTQVGSATDRYANLETNYLLQRLERYRGVMVVTTNAADRIDAAFTRRMDATLDFPLPDALTRLALWQAHLGSLQQVPDDALERVALRCNLSGGQIRNAALHAALLAIERARTIGPGELQQALEREYRKAGQQCPSLEPQD